MKIAVLGANGMLGSACMSEFSSVDGVAAIGSVRSAATIAQMPDNVRPNVRAGVDACDLGAVEAFLRDAAPAIVVNAIGVIKQRSDGQDVLATAPLNTLLPHNLSEMCGRLGARLIHVSTDCVFSGEKGFYRETDIADARDVYGLTKYLGEVDAPHAVTLRTSIIGPELKSGGSSLLDWFLAQDGPVNGFRNAIFSGLPTVELARVMRAVVIQAPGLRGLHHVAASPISKLDLLKLIAQAYGRTNEIRPVDEPRIDRSLDASRFNDATGYCPPSWPELIAAMRTADRRHRD